MKKIILLSLCSLFSFSSCNDFLKEEPKSEVSVEQYFSYPDHARAVVNKLYRVGALSFYDAGDYYGAPAVAYGGYISGFFSNEIYKGQRPIAQWSPVLKHTSENISGELDGVWDACYKAIAMSNVAIKHVPLTPGIDEVEQNQLVAKAKFFRAYNYFFLVKFFGDVPLVLEPYESLDNLYVSRNSVKEVYMQIVEDLTDALDGNLPNESFVQNGFQITKAVVETTLANVYMQMSGYPLQENHYTDAAKYVRDIISDGKHVLTKHENLDDRSAYNILRTSDLESEYIFTREFAESISETGWTYYSFPPIGGQLGIFKYPMTTNVYAPSKEVINFYNPELDLRVKEKQYFFQEYSYEKNGNKETINLGEYCNWFFYNETAMLETGRDGKDFPIYRYSEVLLVAAEAIAQSEGVTEEAVDYLSEVRSRAYTTISREEIEMELRKLSKDDFVKEVWKERLREFPLEFKIWDDIQRTRMYPITISNKPGEINFVSVIGAKNPQGAIYKETDLLWPISKNEMQRNPALIQNPGFK